MIHTGNLYTNLSAYYDLFCADVEYAGQCAFTNRVFECFAQTDGRQYLDLACGTGAHIPIMQSLGFIATGLDNSAEMLAQAAQRCPDAAFILSDMSAFETADRYDLITCFLYSIHYSHPVCALKQTLKRVYDALQPGGVFIFNAVDIKGITNPATINTLRAVLLYHLVGGKVFSADLREGITVPMVASGSTFITLAGGPKVWNGSGWSQSELKVWNGSGWVTGSQLKVWNGSSWSNIT
jgi:ubiquinone/menaquinone biosynthesis C-methylase UbiE